MAVSSSPSVTTNSVAQTVGNPDVTIGTVGTAPEVTVGSSAAKLGFYGTSPIAKQTGVAVTAAAIHAALVALGFISA